jgi:hypothetical protein
MYSVQEEVFICNTAVNNMCVMKENAAETFVKQNLRQQRRVKEQFTEQPKKFETTRSVLDKK